MEGLNTRTSSFVLELKHGSSLELPEGWAILDVWGFPKSNIYWVNYETQTT